MESAIVQVLGYVLAALMLGLWWGERGRRQAAERYAVTGSPEEGARTAVTRVPPDPEQRFSASVQEYTNEAVERGVEHLMEQAREQGLHIDRQALRKDVETMLSGQDVL